MSRLTQTYKLPGTDATLFREFFYQTKEKAMAKFEYVGNVGIYLQGEHALAIQDMRQGRIAYVVIDSKSKLFVIDNRRIETAECMDAIENQDNKRFITAFTHPAKVVITANATSAIIHLHAADEGDDSGLTLWLGSVDMSTMPRYTQKWTLIKQVNELFAFVGLFKMDGVK
jgi:hypothetical protein